MRCTAGGKEKKKDLKLRKRRKAKAVALKLQAQLQADLQEANAGPDPQQRRIHVSATLEALLEITARVLKHAAASPALRGGKAGASCCMAASGKLFPGSEGCLRVAGIIAEGWTMLLPSLTCLSQS